MSIPFHVVADCWVADDMFGADDADWAIYRKIVSKYERRYAGCVS